MHIPHVYISRENKEWLKQRARIERRTMTAIVDRLIEEYVADVANEPPPRKLTKAEREARVRALRDLEEGSAVAESCLERD
jgi:cytochrome c553